MGRDCSRSPRGEKAVKAEDKQPGDAPADAADVIVVETTGASSSDEVVVVDPEPLVENAAQPEVDLLDDSQEPPDPRMEAGLQHVVHSSMLLGHSNEQLYHRLNHYRKKFQRMLDRIDQGFEDWELLANKKRSTVIVQFETLVALRQSVVAKAVGRLKENESLASQVQAMMTALKNEAGAEMKRYNKEILDQQKTSRSRMKSLFGGGVPPKVKGKPKGEKKSRKDESEEEAKSKPAKKSRKDESEEESKSKRAKKSKKDESEEESKSKCAKMSKIDESKEESKSKRAKKSKKDDSSSQSSSSSDSDQEQQSDHEDPEGFGDEDGASEASAQDDDQSESAQDDKTEDMASKNKKPRVADNDEDLWSNSKFTPETEKSKEAEKLDDDLMEMLSEPVYEGFKNQSDA
eukprot:Skav211366  [mRNA]  locus=scaffold1816:43323:47970:+ [translate_table: standard]